MIRLFFTEMSFRKSKIEDKIRDLQYTLNEHLIKIFMSKNPAKNEEYLHWKQEIANRLMEIVQMKLKNGKHLSSTRYFHLLFEEPFSPDYELNIGSWMRDILDANESMVYETTVEQVHHELKEFYADVCDKLEANSLHRKDIYSFIDWIVDL